jgi:hypothetical protein
VTVVEHFDLVLGSQSLEHERVEVVLQDFTKVGIGVYPIPNSSFRRLGIKPLPPIPTLTNAVIGLVSSSAKDTWLKKPHPSLFALSTRYCRNV